MADDDWGNTVDDDGIRAIQAGLDKLRTIAPQRIDRPHRPPTNDGRWRQFKNDYAGEIPAGAVMVITDMTSTGEETGGDAGTGEPLYICDQATTTFVNTQMLMVNGPYACEEDGYGWGIIYGDVQATYDTGTPATRELWGPKPAQWTLSKGYPGFRVLKNFDGSSMTATFRFDPFHRLTGKTTSAFTAGTPSTAYNLWIGPPASGAASSFSTMPALTSLIDLDSGKFIEFWPGSNYWHAVPLECNS